MGLFGKKPKVVKYVNNAFDPNWITRYDLERAERFERKAGMYMFEEPGSKYTEFTVMENDFIEKFREIPEHMDEKVKTEEEAYGVLSDVYGSVEEFLDTGEAMTRIGKECLTEMLEDLEEAKDDELDDDTNSRLDNLEIKALYHLGRLDGRVKLIGIEKAEKYFGEMRRDYNEWKEKEK